MMTRPNLHLLTIILFALGGSTAWVQHPAKPLPPLTLIVAVVGWPKAILTLWHLSL
jgi:hypothetical protein